MTGRQPPPSHHRDRLQEARKALPVYSARHRLVEVVKTSPCLVLVGETGSGKTTQVPRLLLEAGLAAGGAIACTQPRRIAAVTVAQRVANEMGCKLGSQVWRGQRSSLRCGAMGCLAGSVFLCISLCSWIFLPAE